jgi:AcrR family transcriptional regulator
MDDVSARVLARLYPDVFPDEGAGWRERKSAETRIALLEATIDCLQRFGYARTSNRTIAQIAGISHGTMGHHYATKMDLIAAVIDFALYKRMEIFTAEVGKLSESERVHELAGAELYWNSLQTREYAACLELEIASRTEPELKSVYLPRARRFDLIWREEMIRVFPEWADKGEIFTRILAGRSRRA